MTIHSDWSRLLHEECPEAFLGERPPRGQHKVGVIDGHLQLMRLHSGHASWEAFCQSQFVRPLEEMLQAGCPVVVLCFDCYDHVPVYKSMTQGARASKHEVKVFDAHEELPRTIPLDPMLYLMNRNFKLKLIDMLCARVPAMLRLTGKQRLIVDYRRVVEYTAEGGPPLPLDGFEPMGESDVKFCRYVSRFGSALVHAIDGDYMVIALLYYVRRGLSPDNRIFLFRHLSTLETSATKAAAAAAKLKKRARGQDDTRAKAKKCWVDMQMVFSVMARAVWTSGSTRPLRVSTYEPYTDADAVASVAFLMLLAGTDFSRCLPLVGPRRMWDALPHVAWALLHSVRGAAEPGGDDEDDADEADVGASVDEERVQNAVVARLYSIVFEKHVQSLSRAGQADLTGVLAALQRSKLSASTKARLPTADRVRTTVRNLQWVFKYWCKVNGCVDTPVDGQYGWTVGADGACGFTDDVVVG